MRSQRSRRYLGLVILLLAPASLALGHKGHARASGDQPPSAVDQIPSVERAPGDDARAVELDKVAQLYDEKARKILERSCGDCHSSSTRYPWYYTLPGVGGLIDDDIAAAKAHLDISQGFPFLSHASAKEDLQEIASSLKEKTMPPGRYLLLHRNAELTDSERRHVLDWVERSLVILSEPVRP